MSFSHDTQLNTKVPELTMKKFKKKHLLPICQKLYKLREYNFLPFPRYGLIVKLLETYYLIDIVETATDNIVLYENSLRARIPIILCIFFIFFGIFTATRFSSHQFIFSTFFKIIIRLIC